ncbi:efflux RND transporter periplasmic adaptor subunit [Microbulbifer hydrolyticus]|uniref:Efflux RND transporter periplasmic adaptor subunit n=1 Tax=Microbulbifer hydrolyticus TaxID=48074 RepID=A0A6P1T575_9GAMM|nr:efflux RND transporter periplasmic adaptor subunit [Microbulbifer hydrolyticus]MBB5211356.1 membrane fusion protein (multidrug efflux system) [Microbulbifer hydrolyticus]QHQ37888.1 efflux RND transporter periplasmic adaptor subunit [Microbulbifer hydrolyticus]
MNSNGVFSPGVIRPARAALALLATLIFPTALLAQGGPNSGPVPVRTAPVELEQISNPVEALGTTRAWEFVSLRAGVTEHISRIHFESGQRVKAGDVLVELSHGEELAELAGARATLQRYERDEKRLRGLVGKNLTTREQLEVAQTQVAESRALIDGLQARIDDRIIRAPFDGQLGLRNISVGSLATPTTEITTIQDISRLKLDFTVPERQLSAISGGMKIEARSQAHPKRVFNGEVMIVEARVDPQTRAFTVRGRLDNPDGQLKPGMLLRVRIVSNPREALTIPEAALVPMAGDQSVFVVKKTQSGHMVQRRDVELGHRYEGKVEVLSGLAQGEQVVTRGTLHIRDGQAVTVQSERGAANQ